MEKKEESHSGLVAIVRPDAAKMLTLARDLCRFPDKSTHLLQIRVLDIFSEWLSAQLPICRINRPVDENIGFISSKIQCYCPSRRLIVDFIDCDLEIEVL